MERPTVHSAELKWHDYNAAEVLNLDEEEFEQWCRDLSELPEDAIIQPDEITDLHGMFQQLADVARAHLNGTLQRQQIRSLDEAIEDMLSDTCLRPGLQGTGEGEDPRNQIWHPMMLWNIEHSGDAAFFPQHAVELFIDALETLCGNRRRGFGVCEAPSKDDPAESCGNLFLHQRTDAIYCGEACRKRAQRTR